jgi:LPS O-antigen subunit length determinant protein (WzzB/FepE family)
MINPESDQNINHDYEIDVRQLFYVIWDKKFLIVVLTSIFAILSIFYALSLPNIYKSEVVMMPVEDSSGVGGALGQYRGVANLAGISIPSTSSSSKSQEAVTRIQSLEFFSNYFLPNIMLENLLAVKEWNQSSNTIVYDENIFNAETLTWTRIVEPPKSIIPSSQEAYEVYKEVININEDKNTSYVSLSIEHQSPYIAKKWVEIIIQQIDNLMRNKDKKESMRSIEYLNSVASTTNYEAIKQALSSLQQEQMKLLMMVEANENYIFKVLDSPVVPEMKSRPRRSVIVIFGTFFGMMFSVMLSLSLYYFRESSKNN